MTEFTFPDARVLIGDARFKLDDLPERSVQAMITSPPYWALRKYDAPPAVWDDPGRNCAHVWQNFVTKSSNGSVRATMKGETLSGQSATRQPRETAYCGRCTVCGDEHDWQPLAAVTRGGVSHGSALDGRDLTGHQSTQTMHRGAQCRRCPAWLGQLGLEPDPESFVRHLVEVFGHARRVLRDDGVLLVNIADTYNNRAAAGGHKEKDLCGIPQSFVLAMKADGWYYRQVFPWVKFEQTMPESVADRLTSNVEWWIMFAKSRRYFFDVDAVRIPYNAGTIGRYESPMQGVAPQARQPNGDLERREREKGIKEPNPLGRGKRNGEFLLDAIDDRMAALRDELAYLEKIREDGGALVEGGEIAAMLYNPQPFKHAHYATFPPKMIEDMIRMSTPYTACSACGLAYARDVEIEQVYLSKGRLGQRRGDATHCAADGKINRTDNPAIRTRKVVRSRGYRQACACQAPPGPSVVCDPFVGAGSTIVAARRLGRHAVGVDISDVYIRSILLPRLEQEPPSLALIPDYEYVEN